MLKERVVTIKDLNTEDPINAGESKNDREGDKVNKTMKYTRLKRDKRNKNGRNDSAWTEVSSGGN